MAYNLVKVESTKGLDYPWPGDISDLLHAQYIKKLYVSADVRKICDFVLRTRKTDFQIIK